MKLSSMILKFPLVHKVHNLRHFLNLMSLQDRQARLDYHHHGHQLHHKQVAEKEWEQEIHCVSDCIHDLHRPSLNLFQYQWVIAKMVMISHQKKRDKMIWSRSRERVHLHVRVPQEPPIQPLLL